MTQMTEEKKQEMTEKNDETRIYEIGYLIVPILSEEEVIALFADCKEVVRENGGVILSEGEPKIKNLAYSMAKAVGHNKKNYDTAYFGWLSFELPIENTQKVKALFEDKESVIRAIMFKTTREDVIPKKKTSVIRKKKTLRTEEIIDTPASSEEIDKAIEEMIIN